jgi:hypothetical protein
MSPEERRQIAYDGLQTRRTLAALETVARWSSHVNQQPYVELRDLLDTMSSDEARASQTTWLYILSTLSIILLLLVLTSKYWQRPMTLLIRRVFPCPNDQQPRPTQTTNRQAAPRNPPKNPVMTDIPSCVAGPAENMERTASCSAAPLRMEADMIPGPGSAAQPEAAEQMYFAQPGKFQLQK